MTISSNNQAPYGAIATIAKQQDSNTTKDTKESSFNINDTFKSSINIIKQAMPFDGAYAKVSFRDKSGNGIVEMNLTEEVFNKLKSKFTTDMQSTNSTNNEYIASGNAEEYLGGMYELSKWMFPDTNSDGSIDFEEFKKSNTLVVAYDNKKQMPILGELQNYYDDEEILKYKLSIDNKIVSNIDELFNIQTLQFDENLDGVIDKQEVWQNLVPNYQKNIMTIDDIKSPDDLIKLLSVFFPDSETDEAKKKKKAKELGVDMNVLTQMAKDIKSFTDGSSPLIDLLSKLKSSVNG